MPTGPLVHQTWHMSPLSKNYTSSLLCFLSWGYNLELLKGLHPLKVFSKSNSPEKLNLELKHLYVMLIQACSNHDARGQARATVGS